MIIQNNRKRTPAIISILGDDKENTGEETPSGELEQVAQELISAVHEKDIQGTVSALRACYACLESEVSKED